MAVTKLAAGRALHIVAELSDEKTEAVARMVVGPAAALIVAPPLISRLLVQTGRQSGLSVVYTELLDFGGVEMYVRREPALAGKTFRDVVLAYDDSAVMGVVTAGGEVLVPPAFDRVMASGDQGVIAISEDDDTRIVNGRGDEAAIVPNAAAPARQRERTLVLGASLRLPRVLAELDAYVGPESETLVVGAGDALEVLGQLSTTNMTVRSTVGDPTDRALLDTLDVGSFDTVLLLSV